MQLFVGYSCLGWVLMPEVQSVVTDYAERFLEQVAVQVQASECVDVVYGLLLRKFIATFWR